MRSFTGTSRLALLLLLLLLLQLMIPAQMFALQEGGQATVVRFMEVMNKSMCQPMEQLVDVEQEFPGDVEYIYIPPCVPLRRCSGCCSDEEMKCRPTSLSNVTLQVKRVLMKSSQQVELTFVEHQACECRQKRKPKSVKRLSSSRKTIKRRPQTRKQEKKASRCGKLQLQRKKTNIV